MTKKRVVITGMGIVSAFGNDVDAYYDQLLAGKSAVKLITRFPTDEFTTKFAGEISDFDPGEYIDKKRARRLDPFISYALVAGKKALEHAGVDASMLELFDKERCGVIVGSGMGGMSVFVENVQTLLEKGPKRVSPFLIPHIITNMAGGMLAMDLGFMGPNYSISTACATSNHTIIAAAEHIQRGETDLMLAGGSEAAVIPLGLAGFCACRALSQRNDEPTRASRPFDKGRDGFVMGEGAGVLVLESYEHAKKRGATIYAEYLGGASSCDAYHMTDPHPEGKGVSLCIRNALKNAQIAPEKIDYINAHATSTPAGDLAEVNAVKQVIPHPEKVTMNATKSMIGHCLGAASAVEAIATVQAIHRSLIHPTINLENPEEGLAFHIPTKAYEKKVEVAISNSFGFGGHNATIVLGKFR